MKKIIATIVASILICGYHSDAIAQVPQEIAPVKAPFEMPQPVRPLFPNRTADIRKYGAKQGVLSTRAIQKAIDKTAAKGGGTVIVPNGRWLSGRIVMRSNINLKIEKDAVLEFTGNIKDYLPTVLTRYEGNDAYSLGAMIYANGEKNIAITGKGHLLSPDYNTCEIGQRKDGGVSAGVEKMPLEKRIFDGQEGRSLFLPEFFGPVNCENILVEGVTFDRSLFWNICPTYCRNIIIRDVTVNSFGHGRTDGIDIDSSVNTLIEYTTLDCGDDCFTLKAGRGNDGVDKGLPTENVVIRNCTVKRGVGGIAIGSETAGKIRNVYVHDCEFQNAKMPMYIKSRRPRGGGAENITIENVHIGNCSNSAFYFDMLGSVSWVGELAKRYPVREVGKLTPEFRNITFRNVTIDKCKILIKATELPERPIENITFENVKSPSWKMNLQDVGKLTIK